MVDFKALSERKRWKPVLSADGKIYCSPACGCKCTKEGYDRTTTKADALAKRMGAGWKPRVWENGGWHFEVLKANSRVEGEGSEYSAWLQPKSLVNRSHTQFIFRAETPEEALMKAIEACVEHISICDQEMKSVLSGKTPRKRDGDMPDYGFGS